MTGITYFVALPFDVAKLLVNPSNVQALQPRLSVRKVFGRCSVTQVRSRSVALVIQRPATSAMRLCCESLATCRMI